MLDPRSLASEPTSERPCARCDSPNLWVADCSKSADSNDDWKKKKGKKKGKAD
jgi:hypothetical protein